MYFIYNVTVYLVEKSHCIYLFIYKNRMYLVEKSQFIYLYIYKVRMYLFEKPQLYLFVCKVTFYIFYLFVKSQTIN